MAEIRINATGGVKLYDADDSHYCQIVAGTISANVDILTLNSAGVTVADGAIDFDIASHDTSNGLKLGGTLVTSTAAELNIMDGVTSTAAELNIMDGVTSTAAELNIMDGVTSTAAEINLIDGGTARGTTALADGDGVLINDGGTMRMTNVTTVKTYMAGANTPAFSAYLGSDQSVAEDTNVKMSIDTEYFDTDSAFASNKFTVPSGEGGNYFFYGKVQYSSTTANSYLICNFYLNGSSPGAGQAMAVQSPGGTADNFAQVSWLVDLDATDYVELYTFYSGEGADRTFEASRTVFAGFKL